MHAVCGEQDRVFFVLLKIMCLHLQDRFRVIVSAQHGCSRRTLIYIPGAYALYYGDRVCCKMTS
jgi:hypothetical protein